VLEKPTPLPDTSWAQEWENMDRLDKIAWFWMSVNSFISKRLSGLPSERWMTVRLEELTHTRVLEILRFAGLPESWDGETLQKHDSDPGQVDWDSHHIAKFNRIAGETMRSLGYRVRHDS
jgi:hypothetical protein